MIKVQVPVQVAAQMKQAEGAPSFLHIDSPIGCVWAKASGGWSVDLRFYPMAGLTQEAIATSEPRFLRLFDRLIDKLQLHPLEAIRAKRWIMTELTMLIKFGQRTNLEVRS